jgi:hypothetical protein
MVNSRITNPSTKGCWRSWIPHNSCDKTDNETHKKTRCIL